MIEVTRVGKFYSWKGGREETEALTLSLIDCAA